MKRLSILCGMMICAGLLLTGCSNSFDHMPDLTEEQSALIAEYAAGMLIKYDKNAGRLASDQEIEKADARLAALEASTAAFQAAEEEASETEAETEAKAENYGGESSNVEAPFEGIAQFCGLDGFQIDYMGYLVCDSYPPEDSDEVVFAMDASEGNKLLVLRFMAQNTTGEARELDMLGRDIQFRISVNDGEMRNSQSTLLLNDLAAYKDTIPAGSGVELVLTREMAQEELDMVDTITLTLRSESGSATTLL